MAGGIFVIGEWSGDWRHDLPWFLAMGLVALGTVFYAWRKHGKVLP